MGLINSVVTNLLARKVTHQRLEFHYATMVPEETQQRWLRDHVRRGADTGFGQDHGFSGIHTIDDFRRQVPLRTYEQHLPYIEQVMDGRTEALFNGDVVRMFGMTSGSVAERKYIPITDRYLADYLRSWQIWGLQTFEHHPELWLRKKLQLAGNHNEFTTDHGIPCGTISGFTTRLQNWFVRRSYCLPPETAGINSFEAKCYLAWRIGLLMDVGSWFAINPAVHVHLARFGTEHAETLIRDIHTGELSADFSLPADVVGVLSRRLKPNPKRARELERIYERTGELLPKDVWPHLGLIGCWLGGPLSIWLAEFPHYFGDAALRDIGLISTESRMTIPKEDGTPAGILDITSAFFEFLPCSDGSASDDPEAETLLAHELEPGGEYEIVMTTTSGLYRYRLSDVVRCVDFHEQTPMLEFLHKGARVANITGEKISESQVSQAVAAACGRERVPSFAYSLAPCRTDEGTYYGLFIEEDAAARDDAFRLAAAVDDQLQQANSVYRTKRTAGILAPVAPEFLPAGYWQQWDREARARSGAPAEQFKHPYLICDIAFRDTVPLLESTSGRAAGDQGPVTTV